tara:strand:- start:114 stop:602 length:489 start_codon:yes stop_codon:yes gene_type:complete
MKEKYSKIIEVAMSAAAADGISPHELVSTMGTITSVPAVLNAMQNALEKSGVQIESQEFDFFAWTEALTDSISTDVETGDPELIDLDEVYMANASEIIGESLLLNNLCVGLAVYLCAQDGISSLEADAIKTVSSGLKNVDSEIALLMANSMQKVLESIDDEE